MGRCVTAHDRSTRHRGLAAAVPVLTGIAGANGVIFLTATLRADKSIREPELESLLLSRLCCLIVCPKLFHIIVTDFAMVNAAYL